MPGPSQMSRVLGTYWITPTPTAIRRAWKLCGDSPREYQLLRRHTLKLAFWPGSDDPADHVDIDWDWIRGRERIRLGELRIDEQINGHDNVRVVFFKANVIRPSETMPRIWLLTVFSKKRQRFGTSQIEAWAGQREIIVDRFCDGSQFA